MKSQCFRHWEDVSPDISPHQEIPEPPTGNADATPCDAWEARIETTLLVDLSDEERFGLAGHISMCPACAGRFQEYQFIEELMRKIPLESLYEVEYEQRRLRLKEKERRDNAQHLHHDNSL